MTRATVTPLTDEQLAETRRRVDRLRFLAPEALRVTEITLSEEQDLADLRAMVRDDVPALLAEVRRLRALVNELVTVTPPWARPQIRFAIACLHCKTEHTTDEDYGPDLFPAAALADPGSYFDGEWVVSDAGEPCCLRCWEPARCEECGEPIHAWQQAALTDERKYTSHSDCLSDEELGKAEVMPALDAAKVLHEAWAERTHAKHVEMDEAGGEPR